MSYMIPIITVMLLIMMTDRFFEVFVMMIVISVVRRKRFKIFDFTRAYFVKNNLWAFDITRLKEL